MNQKHMMAGRFSILLAVYVVLILFSFLLGRYPIYPDKLVRILLSVVLPIRPNWEPEMATILFQVRLPRVVMACLIGSALSCAGAAFQGVFQNPMVSPDVLGASQGAGFGAALSIFLSVGYFGITLCSFAFGMLSVGLVYFIGRRVKRNPTLGLVLAGIMIGSLFSASTSFIKLMADPNNVLPAITYWLMGSLASIRPRDVAFAAPLILIGLAPIFFLRWKLNVLTMGEEEAQALGIRTAAVRIALIFGSTLITAACVSVSGMIGWVGLVVPHFARMLVGCDYRRLLPASVLMGGSFLLLVDDVARVINTSEIPLGILTAFVGAPFFLYLILRRADF
ncbi:FecCD family ABC transporter permease [Ethanoligenens sp.]|uniref:FecCD family ABC transporter permease n=1 Tax=Ethanoligenens sp. TaxID=2099655 RepID=UPI0039E83257